jgi:hypothetical protein
MSCHGERRVKARHEIT